MTLRRCLRWRAGFFFCTAILAALPFPLTRLAAASSPGLSIETLAERRVLVNGAVEYVRAEQLRVGDEIFYTLRVRNAGASALPDAIVVKSVPRNTTYVANSGVGPGAIVDFSVDGGVTFAAAGQLTVRGAHGVRPALATEYTDIRWRLRHPLAPGATALLRFRATLK